ncbi:hypothetical protein ACOTVS_10455 [Aliarcobacter butzleri]|uniref:hypothetical protein n=1 Tax=Aliarcobacter butzleri TaxID=28197 RepID=UPI00344BD76B
MEIRPKDEIVEYTEKVNFIKQKEKENQSFVLVEFENLLLYFDLESMNKEHKLFYYVPCKENIIKNWKFIAFKTKIKIDELFKIVKVFKTKINLVTESESQNILDSIDRTKNFSNIRKALELY